RRGAALQQPARGPGVIAPAWAGVQEFNLLKTRPVRNRRTTDGLVAISLPPETTRRAQGPRPRGKQSIAAAGLPDQTDHTVAAGRGVSPADALRLLIGRTLEDLALDHAAGQGVGAVPEGEDHIAIVVDGFHDCALIEKKWSRGPRIGRPLPVRRWTGGT